MILQRASAGSGKTFRLAKTYIRLFIADRNEDTGRYLLRHPSRLREAHSAILGVTFTNKATNEMKERIVSKLASLAQVHPEPGCEPQRWHAPDYLLDFTGENPDAHTDTDDIIYDPTGETPASRSQVGKVCGAALRVLLNDYGRFNISTIDTFFQNVLRSFAYELRLNDNYHVELNDDYLAQIGVDRTLSTVNIDGSPAGSGREKEMSEYVSAWARSTIHEHIGRGETWNMFNKSSTAGVYARLLDIARKMSKESFKLTASRLDEYFSDISRFDHFSAACLQASHSVSALYEEAMSTFRSLRDAVREAAGGDDTACYDRMKTPWEHLRSLRPFSHVQPDRLGSKLLPYYCADPPAFDTSKHFLKKSVGAWRNDPGITERFRCLGRALYTWQKQRDYWTTILSRINYMGVLHYIRQSSETFRLENNIIPLSATNEILQRIISNDDTPFIYERIGSRITHYLLDEFQDTSVMQWLNLRPLLAQSTDTGEECLVIGDAKQSIYRFRNAAPEIITTHVPASFPGIRILPAPQAPVSERAKVNTNWRSADTVVRANNTVFTLLPAVMDDKSRPYLQPLYADTVQKVKKRDLPGYMRISFGTPIGSEYMLLQEDDTGGAKKRTDYYAALGYLIDDLRARGYRLSDIAILTDLNSEGAAAIAALMCHNTRMLEADRHYSPIEILSEESLKVSDSAAVKVIIAILGAIARGFRTHEEDTDATPARPASQIRQYELARYVANFQCYLASHSGEPLDEILKKDLDALLPPAEISAMLANLPSATLPAMVESIAARFTGMLGGEQAAYVAAFQDAVLDYCENYPADISSFLTWWEENGKKCSIPAPEGVDAVRVMTIHKSKGLEFQVVLMPKADWNPAPSEYDSSRELIWVEHEPEGLTDLSADEIPPCIPVTPAAHMKDPGSPFHKDYDEFCRRRIADQLNKTYVAFTRAVRELHVCAPVHKTRKPTTVLNIGDYLADALAELPKLENVDTSLMLSASECHYIPGVLMEVGEPTSVRTPHDMKQPKGSGKAIDADIIIIDSYTRTGEPARLHAEPEDE